MIAIAEERPCSTCGKLKALDQFRIRDKSRNLYRAQCKICEYDYMNQYRKKHPERASLYRKHTDEHLRQNPEKYARRKEYMRTFPRKSRPQRKAQAYLTLFEQQGGVCAICGKPETSKDRQGKVRSLALDHNHQTGQFRGLLCFKCNTALAKLEDENFVRAASGYLARHS